MSDLIERIDAIHRIVTQTTNEDPLVVLSDCRAALIARDQRIAELEGENGRLKGEWIATHRHNKGGLYREIMRGRFEWNRGAAVVYDDERGVVWIRHAEEFDDGRFAALATENIINDLRGILSDRSLSAESTAFAKEVADAAEEGDTKDVKP